ncbi:hypothetical protein P691DRAFT_31771 [Macrolepiota fuliginosa MF-IS2]|uniref:Uncharacterized protein n=1 Tax=Macrolepiota fuliginosa MF-IS2 TaxID=1400762 RepID=A0A9P6C4D7_9AGAR|nr:hypothetical protein P691DRAFT_31771 [Macrolepiota fuliginosa MF-IS2]
MELLRIAWRVCMWVCPWVAHWLGFASSAVVTQQPAVEDREHPESLFQVADLTYEIASHLNTGDHHRMLTLNKEIYKSVAPTLWSVIDTTKSINPGALITRLNNVLALNPSSASRIRNWTIDKYSNPGSDKPALATAMADVVMRLATHGHLDELRKFRWLWKFGPPEGVWAALHKK